MAPQNALVPPALQGGRCSSRVDRAAALDLLGASGASSGDLVADRVSCGGSVGDWNKPARTNWRPTLSRATIWAPELSGMMRGSERCCAAALLAVAARMRSTPPLPERRAAHAGGGGERRARRIRHKACKPPLAANARTTWASPPPWRCHHSLPVPVAPSRCSGPRSSSRESKRCSLRNSTVPGTQSQVQGLGSALVLALVQECWCRRLGSAAHRFWKHRSPTRQSLSPASTCAAPTTRGSS
ncbi:unnamed protein product [Prorocentrum cordatum]|uniref:Uncharacterized protein n=1 Tax=Prorocentrum cordatum TaxID=2364126 RepID=A0ABN9T2Z0_9DINO|nr:unnamed protein product [Polarella glacialis]